jgi:hypothetical protein
MKTPGSLDFFPQPGFGGQGEGQVHEGAFPTTAGWELTHAPDF